MKKRKENTAEKCLLNISSLVIFTEPVFLFSFGLKHDASGLGKSPLKNGFTFVALLFTYLTQ